MYQIDYSRIPSHMQDSVQAYIEKGHSIGGFLTAVFSNNLVQSFAEADDINQHHMKAYAELCTRLLENTAVKNPPIE